jgi:Ca2+/Na+ antiporter
MDLLTRIIIPVLIIVGVYGLIKLIAKKEQFKSATFVKARIIIGSVGIGYFLALAIQSGELQDIILTCLFALLLLYGVLSLQNKYMEIKKPES